MILRRLLILVFLAVVVCVMSAGVVAAAVITVDDSGGADFISIQAAVDAASDGDTIEVWSGTYVENVDVGKRLTLQGEGAGVVTVNAASSSDHVFEVTADYVNISGFNATGATGVITDYPDYYDYVIVAGINLNNADHCNISDNAALNNYYGIWLSSSNYNTLMNNTASNNDYGGIYLSSSSNNMLTNNTMSENKYNFNVYGSSLSEYTQNIDMSNTVDGKLIYYWLDQKDRQIPSDAGYIGVVNGTNITIIDLTLTNYNLKVLFAYTENSRIENVTTSNNYYSIYLYASSNNTLTNNDYGGISLYSSSNNTLMNNTASNNDYGGISLSHSCNNTLMNNTLMNNDYCGISLFRSSNNTLTNNTANSNNYYGIRLYSSSNNTLTNNIANSNGDKGIYLFSCNNMFSNNNTLTNNTISNNDYGIHLDSSSNNTLTNNTANSNNYYGIRLDSSSNNTLTNNTASNNDYGIYLGDSGDNLVYNNYFNNAKNAYDDGSNQWNITKTNRTNIVGGPFLGGNYWSNYAGVDNDGDGLGDTLTPYNSSGDITNGGDYHPLVPDPTYFPPEPVCNCTCGDICVNETSWWRDGGTFFASKTPIQSAVDNAGSGETICVSAGSYTENVNIKTPHLTLRGEGAGVVTVRAPVFYLPKDVIYFPVFCVDADYVNISGFTVTHGKSFGEYEGGINLFGANHCNISKNNASSNRCGIYLSSSNNNTLARNNCSNNEHGIYLDYSSNNILEGNNCSNKDYGFYLYSHGICLDYSSNNTLANNTASNSAKGICVGDYSSGIMAEGNMLEGNNCSNNGYGIFLSGSSNTLASNTCSNNDRGIYLYSSSNNMLANNTMSENRYNFNVYGSSLSEYTQNIDMSNTVDGKPIYYLVDQRNRQITGDAGFVGVVNGTNITVRDLTVTNNKNGVLFAYTENSRIENVTTSNNDYGGIYLHTSSNNMLTNNTADSNRYCGIRLSSSSNNNTLANNTASNSDNGIYLGYSSNNTLVNNRASNNYYGIYLYSSSNYNTLVNNRASNNEKGIYMSASSNNMLASNTMLENRYNFNVYGSSLSEYTQNIDMSNTVNGKPIYYWVDQKDRQIPSDASFVGVVNGTNITVKDLTLTNNGEGVLFAYTENSRIENVTTSNNGKGIYLRSSRNDKLANNIASNNFYGIRLDYSSNNTLASNTASNNSNGIYLYSSSDNLIYNNYFNNGKNAYDDGSNKWNTTKTNGPNIIGGPFLGGNYWSDYTGVDNDGDGFGDTLTPYNSLGGITNGGDYHPLVLTAAPDSTYIPPDPVNLTHTLGNYRVNYTWSPGIGNATDSYNVSLNGAWTNGTANTFANTSVGLEGWVNITVFAYNTSGTGTQSSGCVSDNVQAPAAPVCNCTCGDICVNETGWWRDGGALNASTTPIQAAVDNAGSGETICVKAGSYTENVDITTSHLTLRGEGAGVVTVNAPSVLDHVFEVTADYVNISGFTTTRATESYKTGIYLNGTDHCNISENTALNNNRGIYMFYSSNNTLVSNTASNNYGGIYMFYSCNNTLASNTASNNDYGIILDYSSNNTLMNNTALNNYGGIYMYESSNNNTLTENTANSNSDYGIFLDDSSDNLVYNNYFDNTKNAYDDGSNRWSITKTNGPNIIGGPFLGGNYWSDYTGVDNDGDGLGDTLTPYNSLGGITNGGDYHPLVPTATPNSTYIPPDPVNLTHTLGNYRVNYTWSPGTGNATDSYNVSLNGAWMNGTANTFANTSVGLEGWVNITVFAYNTSGTGTQSSGCVSDNVQAPAAPVCNCTCGDICVNETGWWRDGGALNASTTPIQAAVDNAGSGETICVKAGSYTENVDITTSHLTLQGEGAGVVTVNAVSSSDKVFEVTADYVNISGFKATGVTDDPYASYAGFYLGGVNHCNISENTASNNYCKIHLCSSNNNTLANNTASRDEFTGIGLDSSNNNTLVGNTVMRNGEEGIGLDSSNNNTLANNTVSNNGYGIHLRDYSSNNMLANNNVNSNGYSGISLDGSNNTLVNNTADSNGYSGISLGGSNNTLVNNTADSNEYFGISLGGSNNTLVNNAMSKNRYNFGVSGFNLSEYTHNIDTSNTVDGKPIYYWVDQKDRQIPSDAGFVGVVNGTNITVRYLKLTKNKGGVLFAYTENSRIENVTTTNNDIGIHLLHSTNNTLGNNTADSNNGCGIYLLSSSNNTLTNNNANSNYAYGIDLYSSSNNMLTNNNANSNYAYGIDLYSSSNNTLASNNMKSNGYYGIHLVGSSDNLIYNNYFNNTNNAFDYGSNQWNTTKMNGTNIVGGPFLGGNYWSDYTGVDNDGDGLGDTLTPYNPSGGITNDGDYHPLIPDPTYIPPEPVCNCTCGDICVNETGWWRDGGAFIASETPIQGAVYNPGSGETICVAAGNYTENVVITTSHLTLRGEGAGVVTVNAACSSDHVFDVSADYVNISGFTATGATTISYLYCYVAGIHLYGANHCNISNNNASNNCKGIFLDGSSNYNTFTENTASNNERGIYLYSSNNNYNTFTNNTASNNDYGIWLFSSNHNTLANNTASNNKRGIWLDSSSYNTLVNNTASNNKRGISLGSSSYNTLVNNTASNNDYGICLSSSSDNTLASNTMSENMYNFGVWNDFGYFGPDLSKYTQTIDTSNTVDGKPIYYWVDQKDRQIPSDAGFVGVVNGTNITVSDLTLTKNGEGMLFAFTENSRIENVTTSNNDYGIWLESSSNNTFANNTANSNDHCGINLYSSRNNTLASNNMNSNGYCGIRLWYSSNNNMIVNNTANSNGDYGIDLYKSSSNTIANNTANSNNDTGIRLWHSSNNMLASNKANSNFNRGIRLGNSSDNLVYNNYFDNTNNAYDDGSNQWNTTKTNGPNIIGGPFLGGNYWSDYAGVDNDDDGLGDTQTPYNSLGGITNGGDYHPLVPTAAPDATYIPPDPVNLTHTLGNYRVNYTWSPGTGNATDSYNVSLNGAWTNGTANTFANTSVGLEGWVNITVFAYNTSGTGMQSSGCVSDNVQAPAAPVCNCTCGDICVNETGWWRDGGALNASTTPIQAAVDNAGSGETIYVKAGSYTENVDITTSHLTLRGEGAGVVTVNAPSGLDHIFEVTADYVNISGFTTTGATESYKTGIYLNSADHCNISENTAPNNNRGIYMFNSSNNTLVSNTASNNYGGIYMFYSCNNTLASNTASNNDYGIILDYSSNNTLMNNTASNNYGGIYMYESSNNNTLTENTANSNSDYGIFLDDSSNNLVYNNYFDNTKNAYDDGSNQWNTTKTNGPNIIGGPSLGGNYWSDYAGVDNDGDGLGDTLTPYNSSGGIQNSGDYHPLVPCADTNTPVITITTPEPDGIYTVGMMLDFSATDDGSGVHTVVGNLTNTSGLSQNVVGNSSFVPAVGVYDLVVTATDNADNTNISDPVFFVVYDPDGGHATGGGWFYPDDESTLPGGKANFGFTAKYKDGSSTGKLNFQYKDADLHLKSTSIDWLTLSAVSAQFQGTGTINGDGLYTFRVQAKDNGEPGVDIDHFDIKIWNGTDTEADPYHKAKNTISGGNIQVHTN